MHRRARLAPALLALALVALAALPLVGGRFHVQLASQMMVLAIFAISLNLLVGFTGLVSFGHAAFFGIGGYALAVVTRDFAATSMWLSLPASVAAAAVAALAVGALAIRTSGIYFIMVTLAFAQMIYYFFNDASAFGGSDGLYVLRKPQLALGELVLLDLRDRTTFHFVALAALAAAFAFQWALLRSAFGQVVTAISINEGRTRALGYPVARYKLVSFVIAGALAGLAGYLTAAQFGFVNPAHLGWRESGRVLMMVILGGTGTLAGPVVGAFTFVLLEDLLSGLTEHWLLLVGAFVVAVVILLPRGIAGTLFPPSRRESRPDAGERPASPPAAPRRRPPAGPLLETDGLGRRFSGVVAVSDVSLRFEAGKVHAVIGPNGAGKTTLINLLSGELAPTGGRVAYRGRDVTGWSADALSRLGIGRSFQISNLYPSLSCGRNCRIASQSRLPTSMRFFRPASRLQEVEARAGRALEICGLAARRDDLASELSHGERRRLEIAMVLATEPDLLLLDEPLAGMGPQESREFVALLRALAREHTLILIEHDMDAVFAIADTLTVMVNGEVVAAGTVEAVRSDPLVQAAYLGHREAAE